ncbi:hypothetical protein VQ042_05975 [Aurantimonas sp. A2-1-M11]|uniref:hypothetical protein n=1 Tax=Aurantimonas sp. A2-1-M11 TaxID=3113712 RepID=UPI002F926F57
MGWLKVRNVRRRARLPSFTEATIATAATAWFDRGKISYPRLRFLNTTVDGMRDRGRQAASGELFARRNDRVYRIGGGDFLFSGQLWCRDITATHTGLTQRLEITVEANLSRFIQHHGLPSTCLAELDPLPFLRRDPDVQEIGLDGGDNFVPDAGITAALAADWPRELALLLRFIQNAIVRCLDPDDTAGDDQQRTLAEIQAGRQRLRFQADWSGWVVRQIETYWEFRAPDPLAQIEHLRYQLPQLADEVQATHYRTRPAEERVADPNPALGTEGQLRSSQSLSIPLGVKDLRLGIYAKRQNRIRLEIRTYSNTRATLCGHGTRTELPNNSLDDLSRYVRAVADNSSRRLTLFLSVLSRFRPSEPPNAASLSLVLFYIARACETNQALMTNIMRELLDTGRIAVDGTGSSDRRRAINRLVRNRLLEKVSVAINHTGSVYAVHPRYRGVIPALRMALRDSHWPDNPDAV